MASEYISLALQNVSIVHPHKSKLSEAQANNFNTLEQFNGTPTKVKI